MNPQFTCSGCGRPCDITLGVIDGDPAVVSDCTCTDLAGQPVGANPVGNGPSPLEAFRRGVLRQVCRCSALPFPHRPRRHCDELAERTASLDPHPWAEWRSDDAAQRQRDFELGRRADAWLEV